MKEILSLDLERGYQFGISALTSFDYLMEVHSIDFGGTEISQDFLTGIHKARIEIIGSRKVLLRRFYYRSDYFEELLI